MVTGFRLFLLLAAAAVCCEGWLGGKGVQPQKEDDTIDEDAVGGPRTLETGGTASSEQVDPDLEKKVDSLSSENQTGVDLAGAPDRQENGAEQDHRSGDHPAAKSNILASKPISTRGRHKYTHGNISTRGRHKYTHGNISHYISDSVPGYSLRVVTDQLDEHFKTCGDRCMVRGEPREQCPLHDVAPELLTWMTDLKNLLSDGCKLPHDNKGDRCCIANDAAVSGRLRDITLMIRDVYRVLQDSCSKCPVDGGWTEWSTWTQCSVSCDMGTRWQTRTCNNPSPAHGGQPCKGAARQEAVCTLPPCCVTSSWNPWSAWSQCSLTCGNGHRRRSRICADVSPNVCATSCQGPKEETETCNLNEPRDGKWSSWVAWSECSVTCGCGMRSRSRQCSSPERNECGSDCIGNNLEKELCYRPECCEPLDGGWSYWSSWSTCSASCGSGERTRSRICSNPVPNKCGRPCPGQPTERERCEGRQCCVPSSWNPWSAWSQCSVTCGNGHRRRSRICADLLPNVCATSCQGPNEVMETCNVNEPRDGKWSSWVAWSECSVTCGCGMKSRSRQCSSPEKNECGSDCIGNNLENELCYRRDCCEPLDGGWSYWSSWSTCSASCGPGERTRYRTCNNPVPNQCGLPCPGQPTEREICVGRICCVDGNWGPWELTSSCSVTCDRGRQSRTRQCDRPPPNDCGRPCPGPDSDIIDCYTKDCPKAPETPSYPCEYEWSNWSQCSVTCGRGTRSRSLQSKDVRRRDECQNDTTEDKICEIEPRDGGWTPWSPWSDCSARCGPGEKRRYRTCNNPPPDSCGLPCPGLDLERERCDETCCSWSDWSSWSSCNPTCGYAQRSRRRFCVSTSRNDWELLCVNRCPGPSTDVDSCSFIPCEPQPPPPPCKYEWSNWSQCSVTCGRGRRFRSVQLIDMSLRDICWNTTTESEICDIEPRDGGWTPWSPWSDCSARCGPGEKRRYRTCNNPPPDSCGLPCPGLDLERERCQETCCNWSDWSSWSSCPTCGYAERSRQRFCVSTSRNDRELSCVNRCSGPSTDVDTCSFIPCEPPTRTPFYPCEYEWSNWSQCSVTCGRGMRFRILQSKDLRRSDECQRNTMERENCEIEPRDGGWTPWSPWSDCSAWGCPVEKRRYRTCNNPPPDSCGLPCPGPDREIERCEESYCTPTWSSWEAWCPCECRTGLTYRRRACVQRYSNDRVVQAEVNLCQGDSREEKYCDVLESSCPRCVTDCRLRESFGFLENGNYSSCFGCNEFIECTNGEVQFWKCKDGRQFDAFKRKCVTGSSPSCALVECVRNCSGLDDGNYTSCELCGAYEECRNNSQERRDCKGGSEFDMHLKRCRTDRKPSPTCIRSQIGRDIMLADDPNSDLIEDETVTAQNETISENGVSGSHKSKHLPRDHETLPDPTVEDAAGEKTLVPVTKLPLSAVTKPTTSTNEERNVDAKHRNTDDVTTGKRKKPDKKKAGSQPKEIHKNKKHEKKKMKVREERTNKSLLKVKCYTTCSDPGNFQSCQGCQFYLTCTKHGVAHVRKCPDAESWDDLSKKCRLNSSTCSGLVQLVSTDRGSSSDPPTLDDMS